MSASTIREPDEATTALRSKVTTTKKARRPSPRRSRWLPYLLLLPAVIMELLIHIVPMLVGIWMSFIKLTKIYIANWSAAPWAGLQNYAIAVDFDASIGAALLQSFLVTVAFSLLALGISWGLGMAAAVALQQPFRGRGLVRTIFLVPYALPAYAGILTWNFMLQRDTGLVNHVLVDNLHLTGDRPFWLLGGNAFASIVTVAVWRLWPFAFLTPHGRAAEHPVRPLRGRRGRRRRQPAPVAPHHAALAAPGEPRPGPRAVPVDLQRLQHAVRPLRQQPAAGR